MHGTQCGQRQALGLSGGTVANIFIALPEALVMACNASHLAFWTSHDSVCIQLREPHADKARGGGYAHF